MRYISQNYFNTVGQQTIADYIKLKHEALMMKVFHVEIFEVNYAGVKPTLRKLNKGNTYLR